MNIDDRHVEAMTAEKLHSHSPVAGTGAGQVVSHALTIPQAARELGLSAKTLRRLIADGIGPRTFMISLGGRPIMRIMRVELDRYISAHSKGGATVR